VRSLTLYYFEVTAECVNEGIYTNEAQLLLW